MNASADLDCSDSEGTYRKAHTRSERSYHDSSIWLQSRKSITELVIICLIEVGKAYPFSFSTTMVLCNVVIPKADFVVEVL